MERHRPGGPLLDRPIQGSDGRWYTDYGETEIDKQTAQDMELATRFWENQPMNMREAMKKIIQGAVESGSLSIPVGGGETLSEEMKMKLSAYRQLAREEGFKVGRFEYHKNSHTATATISKI